MITPHGEPQHQPPQPHASRRRCNDTGSPCENCFQYDVTNQRTAPNEAWRAVRIGFKCSRTSFLFIVFVYTLAFVTRYFLLLLLLSFSYSLYADWVCLRSRHQSRVTSESWRWSRGRGTLRCARRRWLIFCSCASVFQNEQGEVSLKTRFRNLWKLRVFINSSILRSSQLWPNSPWELLL